MTIFKNKTLLLLTILLSSGSALAGFDVTRMTTVVDDNNGSYTITTTGRLSEDQYSGSSVTDFNQFKPGGENEATINGIINKQNNRMAGQLSVLADGDFTINSLKGDWDVMFTALSVSASEAGVSLAGTVTVNKESYDVSDMPEEIAMLLRRVFWLTRR
ncbi:hypothetical protein OS175_03465 [Marinicella sp. S1101]|uniref:hypothetical protein n=1 Tax=Marinicella marina TaxID=2996016 RepID=UPI0022609DA0|nr:hypothetical protein [Marinicella marina]MCX7552928.1 hypothetical protein [Marinicella marina]MDJ1139763.1 hypothetical protein [Marinicella marina]